MRKTKKVLALLLALILAISMIPMSVMATGTTGDEVDVENTDPSAISTPEQFMAMESGNYYLTNDIDFSKTTITNSNLVANFYGTLNGNGHTISGINLNYTATEETATADVRVSVFGSLGNGSYATSISNLNIDNISITVNDSATKTANGKPMSISFVVGRINTGSKVVIDNVNITNGMINATLGVRYHNAIGGIIADEGYTTVSVNDCSVSGSITATSGETPVNTYVAGIIGFSRYNAGSANSKSVVNNCVNNASITLSYPSEVTPTANSSVGGIFGTAFMSLTVTDCKNNGALVTTAKKGGILGYDLASLLVVIADSNTKSGDIYGEVKSGARLCVAGCTVGDETVTASEQNTAMTPITQASDFSQLNDSEGFFYLTTNISFKDEEVAAYYVNSFSGVLYGAGNTIEELTLNGTTDMGFFFNTASTAHAAIINLNIGTPSAPAKIKTGANSKKIGTLIRAAGYTADSQASGYCTVVSDVDIYVDFTANGGNAGGFVGIAQDFACYDSNIYGNITAAENTAVQYYAGFVGYGANVAVVDGVGGTAYNYELTLVGCNNYADIFANSNANNKYLSGFIGGCQSINTVMSDCRNFGDLICLSGTGYAAGFEVWARNKGCFTISNCMNFGNIQAATSCGAAIAMTTHTSGGWTRVTGFVDFGSVTVTGDTPAANRYTAVMGEADIVVGDCVALTAADMHKGAAVRIDPVVTGLRYKATINETALTKLVNLFGEKAISYGTIIAPAVFVTAAGGDFTVDAMETLENVTRKDLFADKGIDAYVDIPATEWFVGENGVEENVIAGSVVNMAGLYKDNFIGRAYVKITIDANNTVYLYADYATDDDGDVSNDVKNNTRTVEGVTTSAINDLLYKTCDKYYRIEEGKDPVEVTEAAVIAKYSTNVGTEGEYTKFSRYSSEDYGDLTDLLTTINGGNV